MGDSDANADAAQRGPAATATDGLRVVVIGGGTGLSTLLKGLKWYVNTSADRSAARSGKPEISDLSAVVTVSDDGGSSGRLRQELNMLPPGDIRNCMVALSEDEALQSLPRGSDLDHEGFQRGRPLVVGNSGHPRAHLSGYNRQRRIGSTHGGRNAGTWRNQDHGQQGPDQGTFPDP